MGPPRVRLSDHDQRFQKGNVSHLVGHEWPPAEHQQRTGGGGGQRGAVTAFLDCGRQDRRDKRRREQARPTADAQPERIGEYTAALNEDDHRREEEDGEGKGNEIAFGTREMPGGAYAWSQVKTRRSMGTALKADETCLAPVRLADQLGVVPHRAAGQLVVTFVAVVGRAGRCADRLAGGNRQRSNRGKCDPEPAEGTEVAAPNLALPDHAAHHRGTNEGKK